MPREVARCLDWVRITVAKWAKKGAWFGRMDRILREGKKYLEKSGGTSKKGSRGKTSSKNKGGGSVADRAKRAAREFLR
jgi:hypothetical protein